MTIFFNTSANSIYPLKQFLTDSLNRIDKKICMLTLIIFSSLAVVFLFCRKYFDSDKDLKMIAKKLEYDCVFQKIPYDEKLTLAKQAGKYVTKLSFNTIKSKDLKELFESCTNIQELYFNSGFLTDVEIDLLPRNLKALHLISVNFLKSAVSKLPKDLNELHICVMTNLDDNAFQNLPPRLQKLFLDITNDLSIIKRKPKLTDNAFIKLPNDLKYLHASFEGLTENALIHLPKNLEWLELECGTFTNFKKLPRNLEILDLSECDVNPDGLWDLPQTLKSLNLSNCENLKDKHLSVLPKTLEYLYLDNCNKLTDEGIEEKLKDHVNLRAVSRQ